MAGIASIGGFNAALESQRIAAEYSIRALKLQLDAAEQVGAEALHLIKAAAINPDIGRTIDLSV